MSEPHMTHEEVDDIPVLMHVMRERLGFDQAFDETVGSHGNWLGLSKGQVLVTWLTHVLSQCSHYMSHVQDWANARPQTLSRLLGQALRETDLTDDLCWLPLSSAALLGGLRPMPPTVVVVEPVQHWKRDHLPGLFLPGR